MRAALSADPDFRWCLNPSCNAGQIHETGVLPLVPEFVHLLHGEARSGMTILPEFAHLQQGEARNRLVHENPIFVCHACGARHCVVHELEWHDGETCQEYDYRVSGKKRRDEEDATKKTIQLISKKCPRCPTQIEKNAGCDHMTCEISRLLLDVHS
jgi:acyl-coenzyme A synthetase/AMP-(fatty) acid ligase